MRFSYLASALIFGASVVYAVPQASGSCTYVCPAQDEAGFPVGTDPGDQTTSGNTLFCSYPAFPGENPDDFDCTYNLTTGALITDNDVGFCPSGATQNCPTRRRRRGGVPRAPVPTRPKSRDLKERQMKKRTKLQAAKKRYEESA